MPVARVSYLQAPTSPAAPQELPPAEEVQPAGQLSLDMLVSEVQARNPTVAAMAAAWQAAAARYPQVVALDDPMFVAMAAPESFHSIDVEPAYAFEARQKLPWFGKRGWRGQQAQAEAGAAYNELADSRVRLTEMTQLAYYDYYLVDRQLELNRQNATIIAQFRDTAQAKYEAKQVTAQDVLQADVEAGDIERRRLELEQAHRIAVARINVLLRQPALAPLPLPPRALALPRVELDLDALHGVALAQRPDLAAIGARIQAEQAAVVLACKQHYPDVELFGRYDTFWQPSATQSELRTQAGLNMNVPLYHSRIHGAVREAMARVGQRRAEYDQKVLDIQYEVTVAVEQVRQNRATLALYADKLIPASEQNVAAVRANYDANTASFLDLATAQRQLIQLREQREEALVALQRSVAELGRVLGGSYPVPDSSRIDPPVRPSENPAPANPLPPPEAHGAHAIPFARKSPA
ncbi:MAG: TolC family protein [Pirellulales bacterium]|nr:TolC family protein [Pirellulales bacterium]